MGKRSRTRSGRSAKTVRAAPKATGRARAAAAESPPSGPLERARVSWKVAAEAAPGIAKEPGRKPRFDGPTRASRKARGERPAALWGKAPISELAILAGVILLVVGLSRGPGSPAITGGLVMISIAALEFAGREHLRGYRSHSLFLAMIVVILLHFVLAFAVGTHTARSPVFLALDVVLFGLLATALSKQYSIVRLKATPKRSR